MVASLWLELIPLWIAVGLLVLLLVFGLLGRVRGGRYVRPIVELVARVPLFRRLLTKAAQAAMERQNPELAAAQKKLERLGPALKDPRRAQAALSQLTPAERRAYLEAAGDEGQAGADLMNREQRRRLEKARKNAQRGR
jgi:hypothetical protein